MHVIIVNLKGGVVTSVDNIPKGFEVETRDYDTDVYDKGDLFIDSKGEQYYELYYESNEE